MPNFVDDSKLFEVSGGRPPDGDRLYSLDKKTALAYAKQLGNELGKNYLKEWSKHQIEKVTKSCEVVSSEYEKWNSEEN